MSGILKGSALKRCPRCCLACGRDLLAIQCACGRIRYDGGAAPMPPLKGMIPLRIPTYFAFYHSFNAFLIYFLEISAEL